MKREMLHLLIDKIVESELDKVYQILLKFVPEEPPLPDEMEANLTKIENGI